MMMQIIGNAFAAFENKQTNKQKDFKVQKISIDLYLFKKVQLIKKTLVKKSLLRNTRTPLTKYGRGLFHRHNCTRVDEA
jgi:hypothetical protein